MTRKRASSSRSSQRLNYWVKICAILSVVIALFAAFPDWTNSVLKWISDFRNPRDLLIVESDKLQLVKFVDPISLSIDPSKVNWSGSSFDINDIKAPCLSPTKSGCDVIVYSPYSGDAELRMVVTSRASSSPIVINGLLITLKNYQSLSATPFNVLHEDVPRGGSGGYTAYSLAKFSDYLNPDLPVKLQSTDPGRSVGTSALATMANCPQGDCQNFLYINPEEVEGIQLNLPFLSTLLPGWYEFEIKISYSYQGKIYTSKTAYQFDFIKPEVFHPWYLSYSNPLLQESFATIDIANNAVTQVYKPVPTSTLSGTLIFKSEASLDDAYYIWDLESGSITHVGIWNPDYLLNSVPSDDGWEQALEVESRADPNHDINLIVRDLRNGNVTVISANGKCLEFQPSWSPDGRNIAYVVYATEDMEGLKAGQADIYLYNLNSKTSTRITFTPDVIESHPIWINSGEIAFTMPDTSPYGALGVPNNPELGIGIVNIADHKTSKISNADLPEYARVNYWQSASMLYVNTGTTTSVINLDGTQVNSIDVLGSYPESCYLSESKDFNEICFTNTSVDVYNITGINTPLYKLPGSNPTQSLIWGKVMGGGYIVIEMGSEKILQYSSDLHLVGEWSLPGLSRVFSFTPNELIYIPAAIL